MLYLTKQQILDISGCQRDKVEQILKEWFANQKKIALTPDNFSLFAACLDTSGGFMAIRISNVTKTWDGDSSINPDVVGINGFDTKEVVLLAVIFSLQAQGVM